MDVHKLTAELKADIEERQGLTMTPQQSQFLSCLLVSLLSCLPCFIDNYAKCITQPQPPPTGYAPGDRERCEQT